MLLKYALRLEHIGALKSPDDTFYGMNQKATHVLCTWILVLEENTHQNTRLPSIQLMGHNKKYFI